MGSSSFQTDWLEAEIGEGLSTTLRLGLKCGDLESKFGRGPRTLDRSGAGWSRLCLGCKWGVCFSGYPAGHIDSWIAVSTDGMAWLRSGTVVRNSRWKMEKWLWLLNHCLIIETGAYIECWITTQTWLLKIYGIKDSLLVLLSTNKEPTSHKAYHNPWESRNIFPVR
jgi:hypothetical protein